MPQHSSVLRDKDGRYFKEFLIHENLKLKLVQSEAELENYSEIDYSDFYYEEADFYDDLDYDFEEMMYVEDVDYDQAAIDEYLDDPTTFNY